MTDPSGRRIDMGLGNVRLVDPPAGLDLAPESMRYGEPAGCMRLREAVAAWQQVEPSAVAITTGASMGLVAALSSLPRPGSVLIPRPYYSAHARAPALLGFDVLTYALDRDRRWEPSADDVLAAVRPDTRAIVINQPHNPTGAIVPAGTLRRIADIARDAGILTLSDETYAGVVYDGDRVPHVADAFEPDAFVRLLSFSKLFGLPGERIGCAIAGADRVRRIVDAHWALAMSPPATAQRLALATLESHPTRHVSELVAALARNRALAAGLLEDCPDLRFRPPAAGCFIWLEAVDCPLDARELASACRDGGVDVIPGHAFGVSSPVYLRASLAIPPEELVEGVRRLMGVVASLRRKGHAVPR